MRKWIRGNSIYFVFLSAFFVPSLSHAQFPPPIYDLACPSNQSVLRQTEVPQTGHLRAVECVDANGVVSYLSTLNPTSLTINNPAGNGANDITMGIENQVRWACSLSLAYRFQTIAAAVADLSANSPNGGIVYTCPGHTETITSTLVLGDGANKRIALHANLPTIVTCNVTSGACIDLHSGSSIRGWNLGTSSGRTSNFVVILASTATVTSIINIPEGSLTGGAAYILAEDLFLQGNASATVSSAILDVASVNTMGSFTNLYVVPNMSAIGIRVRSSSATNAVSGPLKFINDWVDCNAVSGCQPWKIETGSNTQLVIDVDGGVANHAGSGKPMFEINGNGNSTNALRNIHIENVYAEDTLVGSQIAFKIVDTASVLLNNNGCNIQDTDTCLDISESGANKSANVHAFNLFKSSPTNAATLVSNHITGDTLTGAQLPFYNFGGESTTSAVAPIVFSALDFNIRDALNHTLFNYPAYSSTSPIIPVIWGASDSGTSGLKLRAGLTTNAQEELDFQNTPSGVPTFEWALRLSSSNVFSVVDNVNNINRQIFNQGGNTDIASGGSGAVRINQQANAAVGTGGIAVFSGGASSAETFDLTGPGGAISKGTQSVSGCTLSAAAGGAIAGKFASGTTGTCTVTITLPTAPNGWTCDAHDTTTVADVINQTAFTTTNATISGTTASGDVVAWKCMGW